MILCRLKFCDSDEEDTHESSGDNVIYYEDDPQLPLFSTVTGGYSASKLARIIMNKNIDVNKVCNIQPLGVVKNATFIVDIDHVPFSDLRADDLEEQWNKINLFFHVYKWISTDS